MTVIREHLPSECAELSSRIGIAGWSLPVEHALAFDAAGSHLERYAARFNAVEINSSFYRPHRAATYARWASAVRPDFQFAVKLPKTITHERRLVDCRDLIAGFAAQACHLGDKRGPTLVQLPPSLGFDTDVAARFFDVLKALLPGDSVCEPRHPSWFEVEADRLLLQMHVARVAADPRRVPAARDPGGHRGLAYFRLHGSPVVSRSAYSAQAIADHAARLAAIEATGARTWTIYDNTASGAAVGNALELMRATM